MPGKSILYQILCILFGLHNQGYMVIITSKCYIVNKSLNKTVTYIINTQNFVGNVPFIKWRRYSQNRCLCHYVCIEKSDLEILISCLHESIGLYYSTNGGKIYYLE